MEDECYDEIKIVKVKRSCLRCDKSFKARGKLIRLCPKCKKHPDFNTVSTYTLMSSKFNIDNKKK